MITAPYILSCLKESNSLSEEEIGRLFGLLDYLSESVGSPVSSDSLDFLRRAVSSANYHGDGYRFFLVDQGTCVKKGIFPTLSDAKQSLNVNHKSLISYFLSYREENYCQSWAESLAGLKREMELQRVRRRAINSSLFIIKANLWGVSLLKVSSFLLRTLEDFVSFGKQSLNVLYPDDSLNVRNIRPIQDLKIEVLSMIDDFGKSEEILAAGCNDPEIFKVFDAEEFFLTFKWSL
jgi:hypothetical protein